MSESQEYSGVFSRDAITFNPQLGETNEEFLARIMAILEKKRYVPVGRTIRADLPEPFAIMFAPKDLVDAGVDRNVLIGCCYQLPVPSSMISEIEFYRPTPNRSIVGSDSDHTPPYIQIPERMPETGSESDPMVNNDFPSVTCDGERHTLLDTSGDPDKPDIKGCTRRLVMIKINICMICREEYEAVDGECREIHVIRIGYCDGWLICRACIEKGWAKEEIATALNCEMSLPFSRLFDQKFHGKWIFEIDKKEFLMLKFWRRSQQGVYVTFISNEDIFRHSYRIQDGERPDDVVINVDFTDHQISTSPEEAKSLTLTYENLPTIVPASARNPLLARSVSLRNLFYYNPGLYEDLMEMDSIVSDLPIDIPLVDIPGLYDAVRLQKKEADRSNGEFYQ